MSGWVAGAIAVSGVVGAVAASSSSSKQASAATQAAATQSQAATDAAAISAATQERMFNKQVALQEPWRQAGVNALPELIAQRNAMPAAFTFNNADMYKDPGYAFRVSEGLKALDRTAAARGGLVSGSALKAAGRYGQESASQEYQNAYNRALNEYNAKVGRETTGYNRLASLAGIGQTASTQLSGAASTLGSNLANTYSTGITNAANATAAGLTSSAAANAAGTMGMANTLSSSLGQGINFYQNQQLMNRLFPTSSGSGIYSGIEGLSSNTMAYGGY